MTQPMENNQETGEIVRKHKVETPKTMTIGNSNYRMDTPATMVNYQGDTAMIDSEGNIILPPKKPRNHPMDPLVEQGIMVREGIPYEHIVNNLINNSKGPGYGVKIKGKRLDNTLSGEVFIPTMEEEPYNTQIRLDHAKFRFPEQDNICIYEVTHEVTPAQWEKVKNYVKVTKDKKYLIRAVTKVRYGKGGVMDDITFEKVNSFKEE